MKLMELFKIAYDFLKNENFDGLYLAYDIGDRIVCFGGNPNEAFYGCRSVSVNKKNGECKWFIENNDENEQLLDNADEVEISKEYRYS